MLIGYSGLAGTRQDEIRKQRVINHKSLENFLKCYFSNYAATASVHHNPSVHNVHRTRLLINSILHEYTKIVDVDHETEYVTSPLLKPNYFNTLAKIISDQMFTCPGYELANHVAKHNNSVFMYLFAHRVSSTPWPRWYGATHGDEMAFTFAQPIATHSSGESASAASPWTNPSHRYLNSEKLLTSEIISYWSNFAKFDSPNGVSTAASYKIWPEYTLFEQNFESTNLTNLNESGRYMILKTNGTKVSRGYSLEICQFWNNYLPRLLKENGKHEIIINGFI